MFWFINDRVLDFRIATGDFIKTIYCSFVDRMEPGRRGKIATFGEIDALSMENYSPYCG